jgi:hypothetical protein
MILATSSQLLGFESLSRIFYLQILATAQANKDLKEQRFYEIDPFSKLAHNLNVVVKLVCKWSV